MKRIIMGAVTLINTTKENIAARIYKGLYENILDLSNLEGIHLISSLQTIIEISKRVSTFPRAGTFFLGNGNFHYLTLPILLQYQEPFSLIVFDHHSDAGILPFEGVTSCGSWINDALSMQSNLKRVYIIGLGGENIKQT